MGALLAAWMALQAAEPDDAALRRFEALLARPETRRRGIDRLSHADPEALRRLFPDLDPAVLEAAKENRSLLHSYAPPRLISLDGREEALEDVLGRVERASGLLLHRSSLPRGLKSSLSLEDASTLEALAELGRSASFSILGVESAQIFLQAGLPPARPRCFHGPLMIELERISRRTRLDFASSSTDFWIRLALWWEPRVIPLEPPDAGVVTRAVDDRGRSLLPDEPLVQRSNPDPHPRSGHASILLQGLLAPAADALRLTLEGYFELRLPARVDRASFTKPGVVDLDGLTVTLRKFEPAETGGLLAEVGIRFADRARALDYRPSPADLVFEAEVPLLGLRPSLSAVNVEGLDVTYTIRVPGIRRVEDVRQVTARIPGGEVRKRIPFRFEGVDLR